MRDRLSRKQRAATACANGPKPTAPGTLGHSNAATTLTMWEATSCSSSTFSDDGKGSGCPCTRARLLRNRRTEANTSAYRFTESTLIFPMPYWERASKPSPVAAAPSSSGSRRSAIPFECNRLPDVRLGLRLLASLIVDCTIDSMAQQPWKITPSLAPSGALW